MRKHAVAMRRMERFEKAEALCLFCWRPWSQLQMKDKADIYALGKVYQVN
jgi:hypothetical protein